jgi:hypothetical protein
MSKWTIIGGLMCVGGALLWGFQRLSSLMGQAGSWDRICIYDLVDPGHMTWIDQVTWFHINHALDYIASTPVYILLLVVGAVVLLISGFIKN